MRLLLLLAWACVWAACASPQTPDADAVTPLLNRFAQGLNSADRASVAALFSDDVPDDEVQQYIDNLLMPGAVKTTVRERDRMQLEGAPPGDGYSLVVEF